MPQRLSQELHLAEAGREEGGDSVLLLNEGSVMLCPSSKEGILYLGNLKLVVSV